MTSDLAAVSHDFLGAGHGHNENRTWAVIWLCTAMMVAEIIGGWLFGSIALIADGLHMSTHAGALLLAALAYGFARKHSADPRFSFGTGKFGDLAGFSSAMILGMIALLIGYEAVRRFFTPVPIHFNEAIPIAVLGLGVNLASAWLLGAGHDHGNGHHHGHAHDHDHGHPAEDIAQWLGRDNNMRAAIVHVMADAAVSVLVIAGLLLARWFGLMWMDPLAGLVGAVVIGSWAVTLIRDTGAILLDMTPSERLAARIRASIEQDGDRLTDFHIWRLGPGHLGAIVSVRTASDRRVPYYRAKLRGYAGLSHVTVEVETD